MTMMMFGRGEPSREQSNFLHSANNTAEFFVGEVRNFQQFYNAHDLDKNMQVQLFPVEARQRVAARPPAQTNLDWIMTHHFPRWSGNALPVDTFDIWHVWPMLDGTTAQKSVRDFLVQDFLYIHQLYLIYERDYTDRVLPMKMFGHAARKGV